MADQISVQEFSAIVTKLLESQADVESFSVQGSSVRVKIVSRLRRENVDVFLDFDDGGRITGRFAFAQSKDGSALPQILGNTIASCIRQYRAEQGTRS